MPLHGGNKLITLEDSHTPVYTGSGKRGFLSSANTKATIFSEPSGICFDVGSGITCVSDTGNSVIRMFKKNSEISFVGMPGQKGIEDQIGTLARLSSPSSIKSNKGVVSFVDDNLVRNFRLSSLDVSTVYSSSHKIVDLALGGESTYVLEEI